MYFTIGNTDAPVLVVTQPPSKKAVRDKLPLSFDELSAFAEASNYCGLKQSDFVFVNCAPSMADDVWTNKSKTNRHLKEHASGFRDFLKQADINPKVVITMGALAAQQVFGRPVKITKARGVFHTCGIETSKIDALQVLPMLDVGYVDRTPSMKPLFVTDFKTLKKYMDAQYSLSSLESLAEQVEYSWCTDLTEWLENPPSIMSVDTETTGLQFYKPEVFPFTVQLCRKEGEAICIPVLQSYYPELIRDHHKLINQLKQLLENPSIKKIGHNIKFDHHMLKKINIDMQNWFWCTQQMLFNVDENIQNKSLAEGTRMFVPALSGYSDEFDSTVDKNNMILVDTEKLKRYACGDADACFRLAKKLYEVIKQDNRQRFLFEKVQMPALRAFADMVEPTGVDVDRDALRSLGQALSQREQELKESLLARVPAAIKRKHLEQGKALSFTRSAFVSDILFTKEGFNLTPKVFTKGTAKGAIEDRKPSISVKDHLPHFSTHPFVADYIELSKIQKILSTYIGVEDDGDGNPTGFWKYIYEGKVRPTYRLDNTVTGRSSSEDPNGQNIPKRGQIAKDYRASFIAPIGYKLIQADYSQAELRIVAWHANEPTMIQVYKDGLDLHVSTAAMLGGYSVSDFMLLPDDQQELLRYHAKAVNFGLVYGMIAESYVEYAYTNYKLKLTLEEGKRHHSLFFNTYSRLPVWHEQQKILVKEYGYVRSLHGAKRHLPDIYSKEFWKFKEAERLAINSPIQRFASDLGLITLARLNRDLKAQNYSVPMKACMFIHDALVFLVKDEYVEEALGYIKFYMESTPFERWFGIECPVPIVADLEVGQSLASLSKRKDVCSRIPDWFAPNGDIL